MTNYLQDLSTSDTVEDIRVTATRQTLRFATAIPRLVLEPGVPQELKGEVRFRLRVHLARLEKIGQVEVEPINATVEAPKAKKGKKKAKSTVEGSKPPEDSEPVTERMPASEGLEIEDLLGEDPKPPEQDSPETSESESTDPEEDDVDALLSDA
jgi:hypothetical protein